MLNLPEATLAALEVQATVGEASRFARRSHIHAGIVGIRGRDDYRLLLLTFAAEFAQTVLGKKCKKFGFIAARQMMPDRQRVPRCGVHRWQWPLHHRVQRRLDAFLSILSGGMA
ncbi:hypothetical protein OVA07_16005 [Novosphingobium sp. SL115]|uniref:hypothetical protein n=1 Tax=Novosphingobium sp. SL115 TaxID=2995150 RepID=UPI002274D825|nr:hypothetical protein [Novosphingobium sp. SL115]MCY1672507.1 hypothetical protein [Novosphingobium sp. SL115]